MWYFSASVFEEPQHCLSQFANYVCYQFALLPVVQLVFSFPHILANTCLPTNVFGFYSSLPNGCAVVQYVIVVLIYIFLMAAEIEHLFCACLSFCNQEGKIDL